MKRKKKLSFADIKSFVRSSRGVSLLIVMASCLLMVLIFVISAAPKRYDLIVGDVPQVTIAATKDVVDEIATEEAREKARASVSVPYVLQTEVMDEVLADYDAAFDELRSVRAKAAGREMAELSPEEIQEMREMVTCFPMSDIQLTTLLSRTSTEENFERMYTNLRNIIESIYLDSTNGILPGRENEIVNSVEQSARATVNSRLLTNIGKVIVSRVIRSNLVQDEEEYLEKQMAAWDTVEPIVYKQGTNIVEKGKGTVTENQISMLKTLGLLKGSNIDWRLYVGGILLILLVTVITALLIQRTCPDIANSWVYVLICCIAVVFTFALCAATRLINAYLCPLLLCAMLLTALINMRCAIVFNAALTVLVATLAASSSEVWGEQMALMITSTVISGTTVCMMMNGRFTRLRALVCIPATAALDALIFLAYGLMTSDTLDSNMAALAWQCGGIAIAALLYLALQPLLETIFNLPTASKLTELSDLNQPLLKKLLMEAPGTYHHSIIVANLAETCAEAIGANALLARVGGYYHDVGKLKRPLFFKENQMGEENAHDHTDPQVSAAILTAHPKDGVAIAKSYRLPKVVLDIIGSHHGNTPVMFFYRKACELAGGEPVDIDQFRYDAEPPKTREAAIILMCDTIEAAVRSMKNPTPQTIEDFVIKLVRGKLEDGQLNQCDLTLHDIDVICETCTRVLSGVFHERIAYPDAPKNQPKEESRFMKPKEEVQAREPEKKATEAETTADAAAENASEKADEAAEKPNTDAAAEETPAADTDTEKNAEEASTAKNNGNTEEPENAVQTEAVKEAPASSENEVPVAEPAAADVQMQPAAAETVPAEPIPQPAAEQTADASAPGMQEETPRKSAPAMTQEEIAQAVERLTDEVEGHRTGNDIRSQAEEAARAEHYGVQQTQSAADGIVFVTPQNKEGIQTVDLGAPTVGPLILDDILNNMSTKGKLEKADKTEKEESNESSNQL